MSDRRAFHICVAALREGALARYLDFGLSSQLAPGNLPALNLAPPSAYKLFFPATERELLDASPVFRSLKRLIEPSLAPVGPDQIGRGMADVIETACEGAIIHPAVEAGAAMMFLPPDAILSDGSLAKISSWIAEGAHAVLAPRLIVSAEAAAPFGNIFREQGYLSLAPRSLAAFALKHLHQRSLAQYWTSSQIDPLPDQLLFSAGKSGLISVAIRPQVLACAPPDRDAAMKAGSAADLVEVACPDLAGVRSVADSDDVLLVDVWREEDGHVVSAFPRNAFGIAPWAEHAILPRPGAMPAICRIHDGRADLEAMTEAVRGAMALGDELRGLLATPDWYLFGFDRRRLGARLARRHRILPPAIRPRAYHPALRGLMTPMRDLEANFPPDLTSAERAMIAFMAGEPFIESGEAMASQSRAFERLWRNLKAAGR